MLALITELRAALGWRAFVGFLIVAAVSLVVYDFTANGKSYFETVTQYFTAKFAELRQSGEAADAAGKGAVSIARKPYADDLAKQELRKLTAEADEKESLALKARTEAAVAQQELKKKYFDTAQSQYQATLSGAINRSMGLPALPSPQRTVAPNDDAANDCLTTHDCARRMTNAVLPDALRGTPQQTPNYKGLADCASYLPGKALNTGQGRKPRPMPPECGGERSDALGDSKFGEGKIADAEYRKAFAALPQGRGWNSGETVRSLEGLNDVFGAQQKPDFGKLAEDSFRANQYVPKPPAPNLAEARANWNLCATDRLMGGNSFFPNPPDCPPQQPLPNYGQLAEDSFRANQYVPGKLWREQMRAQAPNVPGFGAPKDNPVSSLTQKSFDQTTCDLGINGSCPAEAPTPQENVGRAYYRTNLALVDKMMGPNSVLHGVGLPHEKWLAYGDCAERLAMWQGWKYTGNGAFAVGESGSCGWSVSKTSASEARAVAAQTCSQRHGQNCRVVAQK